MTEFTTLLIRLYKFELFYATKNIVWYAFTALQNKLVLPFFYDLDHNRDCFNKDST